MSVQRVGEALKRLAHDGAGLRAAAVVLVFAIGIGLRIYVYAAGRSLWFDEAVLALNLVHRSLGDLFPPYEYGQVAPVGFMLLAKGFMLVLGNSDYVVRLVPLLAGVATVPLTYLLARKWSRGWASLLAVGLLALSPALIYYSTEVKQYSSDALVSLVLLLAGSACSDYEAPPNRLILLGVVGLLGMWVSQPSLFVLAGVMLTLAIASVWHREWPRLLRLVLLGTLFAANFGVIYLTSLRQWAGDPGLISFWQGRFAPLPGLDSLGWYRQALGDVANPSALSTGRLAMVLFVVGVISFGLRSGRVLSLAVAPMLIAVVASGLRLYPFTGRFLLFSAPLAFVVTAEGVDRLGRLLARWSAPLGTLVAIACAGAMLIEPAGNAIRWIQSPPMRDHIKPALAYLSQHRQGSDVVYLYYMALPQYRYYAPFYGLEDIQPVDGIARRGRPIEYLADINPLLGKPRVWFVFSHSYRSGKLDEQVYIVQYLDQMGRRLDEYYSSGATIYLYDLANPPPG